MSVEVEDEKLIPDEYMKIKREPDKTAIKDAFKNDGLLVDGTNIVTDKVTIQFK
jgi:hypothetical protein